MSERIIFMDANEYSSEVQECAKKLVIRLNTYCPMYSISGLIEAINQLPEPSNKIMMAKLGLKTGKPLEYKKEILEAAGITNEANLTPINLIVRDSMLLLKTEEYRLYYDSNIITGMQCFCDIPKEMSKLVLFRHLQFLKTMLDTGEPYEKFYHYDCSITGLHDRIDKILSKVERECLIRAYGLESGIREEAYYISNSLKSVPNEFKMTTHYVFSQISSALNDLYIAKKAFMQFPTEE